VMRSTGMDGSRVITVEMIVPNVNSWRGVSPSGVNWIMVKTGTGTYKYTLDPGIQLLTAIPTASGGIIAASQNVFFNGFEIAMVTHAGAALDTQHLVICTALDKRL
jgi:hypothetical protein